MLPPKDHFTYELGEILATGTPLFDFQYPYYTKEQKARFEKKFIDHYSTRQIGFGTFGKFKHRLKVKLNIIMDYYIQRYKSVDIMNAIEDPFGNVDIVETFEQSATSKSSGENRFLDTPEGEVDNIDDYLTNASKSSEGSEGTVKHTFTKKGNQGTSTYAHDMNEFRKSFINVDEEIIRECNDLFLGVY